MEILFFIIIKSHLCVHAASSWMNTISGGLNSCWLSSCKRVISDAFVFVSRLRLCDGVLMLNLAEFRLIRSVFCYSVRLRR